MMLVTQQCLESCMGVGGHAVMLAQRSDMEKRATMWVLLLLVCSLKLVTTTPTKYSGQSSVHIQLQPGSVY